MRIRGVDPRDTTWELDHPRYRVYFWDRAVNVADEYEVSDADVDEVLAWATRHAAEHGVTYTLWALVPEQWGDGPGLIRLAGVAGDPFATA
ncbi:MULTISPECIES: hypothetical protein [unclassified Streptomyces]|uniref:Uncharacterized protein n=1 Tax=Streptomyces millisiae TaxID=3075542 RepID=A0ABU2LRB8_9ACTN|nr:hypothetical protein [Streptomyces sp. DSM 44918]MDT0320138.1 hypothetical protein [Streptomyces sp. DSM 44918]